MPPSSGVARQWFVPGDGIDRQVISADIQRYLGSDATVRPGMGTGQYEGVQGYWVMAYRNLTSAMVNDLQNDSQRWRQERAQIGSTQSYSDSRTYDRGYAQSSQFAYGQPDVYGQPDAYGRYPIRQIVDHMQMDIRKPSAQQQASSSKQPGGGYQTAYMDTGTIHSRALQSPHITLGYGQDPPPQEYAPTISQQLRAPRNYRPYPDRSLTYPSPPLTLSSDQSRRSGPPSQLYPKEVRYASAFPADPPVRGPQPRPAAGYTQIGEYYVPESQISRLYRSNAMYSTADPQNARQRATDPQPRKLGSNEPCRAQPHVDLAKESFDEFGCSKAAQLSKKYDDHRDIADDLHRRTTTLLRILRHASQVGRVRGSGENRSNGRSGSSDGGPNAGSTSQKRGQDSQGGYGARHGAGNFDSEGNQEGGVKRRKHDHGDKGEGDAKRLPCIYRVHDPFRFRDCNEFPYMSRVQKHLAGSHHVYVCRHCLTRFDDKPAFLAHTHDPACSIGTCSRKLPRDVGLRGRCDCLNTAERRWLGLYHLCFPTDNIPEIFGYEERTFPKTLAEMNTFNEKVLPDYSGIGHMATFPETATLQTNFLDPTPFDGGLNTNGYYLFSPQAGQTMNSDGISSQNQIYGLHTHTLGIHQGIEQFQRSLDTSKTSESDYDLKHREAQRLQKRVLQVEQQLKQAKGVLRVVWESYQNSGHPNARPGSALAQLVDALPIEGNESTSSRRSSDERTASSNVGGGYSSSPPTNVSMRLQGLGLPDEEFDFDFDFDQACG